MLKAFMNDDDQSLPDMPSFEPEPIVIEERPIKKKQKRSKIVKDKAPSNKSDYGADPAKIEQEPLEESDMFKVFIDDGDQSLPEMPSFEPEPIIIEQNTVKKKQKRSKINKEQVPSHKLDFEGEPAQIEQKPAEESEMLKVFINNGEQSLSDMPDFEPEPVAIEHIRLEEMEKLKAFINDGDKSLSDMSDFQQKPSIKRQTSFKENRKTKLQLTWKNISIIAPPKKKMCQKLSPNDKGFTILNDLSGTVKPGQFLAIIGASGAGKTTLLNYLSGKDPSKNLEKHGEVLINGINRDKLNYKKYVAYVQQDDVLSQCLTVRECLEFAARMKLHPSVNIKERVDLILEGLKLEKAANTKIGGSLVKGVSGGERKRTSIGVELITDPNMIFLDEPTTGLDSFTASTIVHVLHDLASTGRTVMCTIHQPNSEIFESFDQLMLLAAGRIIFQNSARVATKHFKSIGYPCPPLTNPADHFMFIMSIEAYDDPDHKDQEVVKKNRTMIEEDYQEKILYMHDKYENSEYRIDPDDLHPDANGFDEHQEVKYSAPFCVQFNHLFIRAIKNIIRLPLTSYVRILSYILISIMIVLVFGQLGTDSQSIQNRNGLLNMIGSLIIMNSLQGVILIFPDEKPVFLREQGENLYSVTAYFFSKIASDIPMIIINTNVVALIIYFICQLNTNTASRFFIFYGYCYLLMWSCTGLGFLIGAIVPDKNVGLSLMTIISFVLSNP